MKEPRTNAICGEVTAAVQKPPHDGQRCTPPGSNGEAIPMSACSSQIGSVLEGQFAHCKNEAWIKWWAQLHWPAFARMNSISADCCTWNGISFLLVYMNVNGAVYGLFGSVTQSVFATPITKHLTKLHSMAGAASGNGSSGSSRGGGGGGGGAASSGAPAPPRPRPRPPRPPPRPPRPRPFPGAASAGAGTAGAGAAASALRQSHGTSWEQNYWDSAHCQS